MNRFYRNARLKFNLEFLAPSVVQSLRTGAKRSASHLANQVSPHSPLVPSTLARARRAYPSQAQLGYAGAKRSASHLANRVQTSNKAHDKFVPRRDCACADHSRPSLSTALLSAGLHTLHFNPHHTIITVKQIIETSEFAISRSYREVKQLRITDRNSSVR